MQKVKYYIYIAFLIAAVIGIYLVINHSRVIPPEITLISPENGEYLKNREVSLSWVITYDKDIQFVKSVYIGESTPTDLVYEGLDDSYTLEDLKPGTYFWKVILKFGTKFVESPVYKFVVVNSSPEVPRLDFPENGSTLFQKEITFSWNSQDPDGDPLKFDLYLGKFPIPELFKQDLLESSLTISNLEPGLYYWKIVAKDLYGAVSESDVYSFEYVGMQLKQPVINIEKYDGQVKIYWDKYENVKYYIELFENEKFSTFEVENTYYTLKIKPGVKYKLRLKIEDQYGQVAYSEYKELYLENTPPEYRILFPPDNLKAVTNKINFRWELKDKEDDSFINLYIGENPNDLKMVVSNYKGLMYEVRNLKPNTEYYWKIDVFDPFYKVESPIYSFSTGPLIVIKNIYGTGANEVVNDFIKYGNGYVILGTQGGNGPILLKILGDRRQILEISEKGEGVKVLEKDGIIYVLGNSERENGNIFLTAVNNWEIQWTRNYGGIFKDVASDMIVESDGIVILGYSWSDDFIGKLYGWCDIFLMKVDFNGNIKWIQKYGGTQYDEGVKLIKFGNNYIIASNTTSSDIDVPRNYGSKDMWIFSVDEDGKFKWLRVFGTKDSDVIINFKVIDGLLYVLGKTYKEKDGEIVEDSNIWMIVLDENGNKLRDYVFSGNGNDVANDILKVDEDYFLLFGYTNSTSGDFYTNYYSKKGYYDFFISKLTKNHLEWSRVSGGYGYDEIVKAIMDNNEIVFVGNSSSTNGEFDVNYGGIDIFMGIMKIER
ncbi:MAG: hypothetical protein H0Z24_06355 [Thermosipho sp. (in: Bacteria)]|nr:hypothetical protein [Thermosipho sp. (in: thermotogales)]